MRSPPATPQHPSGASPLRSAPPQQATPPCSPARPPSHPPAILSPSDSALHPCPPFRGPRATVRCVCPPLQRSPKGPAHTCARSRGAPLPQCTPSRTFSGDPVGQRVPGGDCGRPSRPGQAQGLGVCTGAPFARSGRRGDSSGVPRARSPQPPAPAASGSQGGVTHSPRGGRTATNSAIPSPPSPRPRRRSLPRSFRRGAGVGERACAAAGRSPSVSGPEEGRLQRARRLKTAALGPGDAPPCPPSGPQRACSSAEPCAPRLPYPPSPPDQAGAPLSEPGARSGPCARPRLRAPGAATQACGPRAHRYRDPAAHAPRRRRPEELDGCTCRKGSPRRAPPPAFFSPQALERSGGLRGAG